MPWRRLLPGARRATSPEVANSTRYQRFVIICDARTGSNMLVQALNSSPSIVCFREVFNFQQESYIDFEVGGYDGAHPAEVALREREPLRFLRTRIFCEHEPETKAVGFKFPYNHHWGYRGLVEHLVADEVLRVIHLRRRDPVRSLVSQRLAERSGQWILPAGSLAPGIEPIHISVEECRGYFYRQGVVPAHWDSLFRDHAKLTVHYEDLVATAPTEYRRVQAFLGLDPVPLTVTIQRQNPQPLRELIENYAELQEAFRGDPVGRFFP